MRVILPSLNGSARTSSPFECRIGWAPVLLQDPSGRQGCADSGHSRDHDRTNKFDRVGVGILAKLGILSRKNRRPRAPPAPIPPQTVAPPPSPNGPAVGRTFVSAERAAILAGQRERARHHGAADPE